MINTITWIIDPSNNPNLKLDFNSSEEKNKFLAYAKSQAAALGLDFPLVNYSSDNEDKSLIILASKSPKMSCGCYISTGASGEKKLAVNFGTSALQNALLPQMEVSEKHAEMWAKYHTIYFYPDVLPKVNATFQLGPKPHVVPNNSNNQEQASSEITLSAKKTNTGSKVAIEIEFPNHEQQQLFLKNVEKKADNLGVTYLPFKIQDNNKVVIQASNYPNIPYVGCYIAKNGEIAINLESKEFGQFVLTELGIKNKGIQDNNAFYFNTQTFSFDTPVLKIPFESQNQAVPQEPKLPPKPQAIKIEPSLNKVNKNNQSISDIKLRALDIGTKETPKVEIEIEFANQEELQQFIDNVDKQAAMLGLDFYPLEIQEPNKVLIISSNYPAQPAGCYYSKNKEVAINFGNHDFRNVVLSLLGIDKSLGEQPAKEEVGNEAFYFNPKIFSKDKSLTLTVEPKKVAKIAVGSQKNSFFNNSNNNSQVPVLSANKDFLRSPNGLAAVNYVFDEFLKKPYNANLKTPPEEIKKFWPEWYNMAQDWSLSTNSGVVQRPNHGVAHTLRVAQLVPVIAEFLKEYSSIPGVQNLSQKEIQQAQYMMLFSVIGRENDMSWTDANNYQKACVQATGKNSEHLYYLFKKKAEKGFINHVLNNQNDLIPSLFANKNELKYWAEALDTGKPGISTPSGILMALAHDLDLMRCYDKNTFKEKKLDYLVKILGNNEQAAERLVDYARDLIVATGDRCMGYGNSCNYNTKVFVPSSLNPQHCLDKIDNVPKPNLQMPKYEF